MKEKITIDKFSTKDKTLISKKPLEFKIRHTDLDSGERGRLPIISAQCGAFTVWVAENSDKSLKQRISEEIARIYNHWKKIKDPGIFGSTKELWESTFKEVKK